MSDTYGHLGRVFWDIVDLKIECKRQGEEIERLKKGMEAALASDAHECRFIIAKLLEDPAFVPVDYSETAKKGGD